MASHDDELTLEALDEQIDALARAPQPLPTDRQQTPTSQLIQQLSHLYQEDQATAQAVDAVRQRLQDRGAVPARQRQRARHAGPPRRQESGPPPQAYAPSTPRRRGFSTRLLTIAAAVLLVVVVSGLVAGLVLVRQHGPAVSNQPTAKPGQTAQPTQTSVPAEIAYISDHNIWEITWPGGTPKQLTTDGVATNRYFGLTWSPDGSLLAAVKETVSADNGSIVIMKPDGSVVASTPFPAAPDNFPLAWSPDGTMLAFRAYLADVDPSKAAMGLETLFIFDAHTAKTLKTVDFVRNVGTGCGRGYVSSLILAIEAQHYAYEGIDTFTWAPDQNSIIVTRECFNGLAARLDLNTGTLTPGFPEDASYQPGGNLISGILDHTTYVTPTLGLTDVNGKTVRELAEGANPSLTPQYLLGMGRSFWSPDGQVIYYESDDSIWQINLDGTNAHIVIPGTAIDSQNHVTIQVLGGLSPNRQMLYLQIKGTYYADPPDNAQLTEQWYVAQADGSNPQPLPQGISNVVWRPGN